VKSAGHLSVIGSVDELKNKDGCSGLKKSAGFAPPFYGRYYFHLRQMPAVK